MRILSLVFSFILFSQFLFAQNNLEEMRNMPEYYFVELILILDRPILDSVTIAEIQTAHLNNIDSLSIAGKLVIAGLFGEGGRIFILKVVSIEEGTQICESDPAIKRSIKF